MNLARSVAEVLAEHVSFELECIDRMYCNIYQPRLQHVGGVVGYIRRHLGLSVPSTVPLGAISDRFIRKVHAFATAHHVPWVDFVKGQRKDDVMHQQLAVFEATGRTEGVVFIGRAQERTTVFRTEKRRNAAGHAYPWIVQTSGMVNHFYFYCLDADFGPFFIKFCSYFPYTAKLCFNGHHWAQRQAARAGIGFTAMDNAFAAVDDSAGLQAICDRFGPGHIQALLDKWLARLPDPFTPDDRADGFDYRVSILQAEFSLTQMLDAPVTGRIFFEHVIRDNLDIGRADQIGLIFDRRIQHGRKRSTRSRFRTRVITDGVTPSLHAEYKHTTVKQYHKEGRALRTETTINNPGDFGIRKGLVNLSALRKIGFSANRRLLGVQRLDHDPIAGTEALHAVTDPILTPHGSRVPGLPIGKPRSHALFSALLTFRTQLDGFTNHDLRQLTGQLRGLDPAAVSAGQATYDLRRLRTHQLIEKVPHSHRYRVTDTGLHTAMLLTRVHDRYLPTALATQREPSNNPLKAARDNYQRTLDHLAQQNGLTA